MAKVTGLAWTTLSVDDASGTPQPILNDITSASFTTPRGVQEVTGLNKSATERLLLLADGTVELDGVFNPAANQEHDVFKTVPSTSVNRTTTITTNGKTLPMEILYTDYQIARPITGELTWKAPGVLADGTVPTWA